MSKRHSPGNKGLGIAVDHISDVKSAIGDIRHHFAKMIFKVAKSLNFPHWVYKNHALVIKLIKLRDTFLAKFFVVAAKLFNDCAHNIGAQWLSY
jgi:hypothetical protein